jgi:hypothetical protein
MATWIWLNLCLGTLFVLAVVGIPLWLVIARPDAGRERRSVPPTRFAPVSAPPTRPVRAGTGRGARAGQPARRSRAAVS